MTRPHTDAEYAAIHQAWTTKGVLAARELLQVGLSEAEIRRWVRRGWLAHVARGVYASSRVPPTPARPILVAAARVPHAVVTGLAALFLHGMIDEVPSEIWLAIPADSQRPRVGPPVRFVWSEILEVEVHEVEGVAVRVAASKRALADCARRHVPVVAVPTTPAPEGAAAA